MFRPGTIARVLCCVLALAVAACATQKKVTMTEVYGPDTPPVQAPPPQKTKIQIPIMVRVVTFVGGSFARAFSIFPHKKKLPVANPPPWVGTIRVVNSEDKFVLIDGLSLAAAQPGDILLTISDKSESATLRMSALTDPPFVIADIVDGKPSVGDRVYAPKKAIPQ